MYCCVSHHALPLICNQDPDGVTQRHGVTRIVRILKLLYVSKVLGWCPKSKGKTFPLSFPLLKFGVPSPMSLRSYCLSRLPGRVTQSFSEVPRYTWRDSALHQSSGGGISKCHRVLEGFQSSVTEPCGVYRHPSLRTVRPAAHSRGRPRAHGRAEPLPPIWLGSQPAAPKQHWQSPAHPAPSHGRTPPPGPCAGLPEGALPV